MRPPATEFNDAAVARDAGTVTTWNLVSRLTGFARVVVVGGALGATRLGDTYQAANQVSNVLFEFLVAGTLSAVLVPGLVTRLADGNRDRAEAFAGALLGRALAVLGVIVAVGILAARPIMRVLLDGNDTSSRAAQVRLGAFLLLFVLPQLLLYAWGAVVTATLHAEGRFAAAAAAPVANNAVVVVALGLFWAGGATGLDLGVSDRVLLGAGALGGVLAMTAIPAIAARRAGISLRPRWNIAEPLAASLRDIAWASSVVIPAQLFLLGSLVVAGRVAGGVVACQIAFTLFLLPHALLGHPLATVLYPRIARGWTNGAFDDARRDADRGMRLLLVLTAPAAALLVALAPWLLRVIAIGALARGAGASVVAAALAGYGLGLTAYSWSLFVTRVSYATGDVRTPGLAALAGGVAGGVLLVVAARSDGTALLYRIGLAHSVMVATAAVATLVVLTRRRVLDVAWGRWITVAVAASLAGVAARVWADALGPGEGRMGAIAITAAGAIAGCVVYAAALRAGGTRLVELRADLS
ncbi:MAG: putative peptidoglycan lipid flippase [Actinomycetota bacterium]